MPVKGSSYGRKVEVDINSDNDVLYDSCVEFHKCMNKILDVRPSRVRLESGARIDGCFTRKMIKNGASLGFYMGFFLVSANASKYHRNDPYFRDHEYLAGPVDKPPWVSKSQWDKLTARTELWNIDGSPHAGNKFGKLCYINSVTHGRVWATEDGVTQLQPNCSFTAQGEVVTSRDIFEGEELFLNYQMARSSTKKRSARYSTLLRLHPAISSSEQKSDESSGEDGILDPSDDEGEKSDGRVYIDLTLGSESE